MAGTQVPVPSFIIFPGTLAEAALELKKPGLEPKLRYRIPASKWWLKLLCHNPHAFLSLFLADTPQTFKDGHL